MRITKRSFIIFLVFSVLSCGRNDKCCRENKGGSYFVLQTIDTSSYCELLKPIDTVLPEISNKTIRKYLINSLINNVPQDDEYYIFFENGFTEDCICVHAGDIIANDVITSDKIIGLAKMIKVIMAKSRYIKILINGTLIHEKQVDTKYRILRIFKKNDTLIFQHGNVFPIYM